MVLFAFLLFIPTHNFWNKWCFQLRVCHKLTTKLKREIILGSSSLDDPPQFITVCEFSHFSFLVSCSPIFCLPWDFNWIFLCRKICQSIELGNCQSLLEHNIKCLIYILTKYSLIYWNIQKKIYSLHFVFTCNGEKKSHRKSKSVLFIDFFPFIPL